MINGTIGHLDVSSGVYTRSVLAALSAELGDELVGMYLYGSSMLGDFVPGRSDIDVFAVCKESLAEQRARRIAQALVAVPRPVQVKGLDVNLVTLAEVAALTGLSVAEVIARHLAAEYRVGWLGFAPGFGYLTGLDPLLAAVPGSTHGYDTVEVGRQGVPGHRRGADVLNTIPAQEMKIAGLVNEPDDLQPTHGVGSAPDSAWGCISPRTASAADRAATAAARQ